MGKPRFRWKDAIWGVRCRFTPNTKLEGSKERKTLEEYDREHCNAKKDRSAREEKEEQIKIRLLHLQ